MPDPIIPDSSKPPLFLGIGNVQIVFGCGETTYLGVYNNKLAPAGLTDAIFVDEAMPCYPVTGDPGNKTALDDLTSQFAAEFLNWFNIQFDYSYAGVVNIQPNGFIDEIEIVYDPGTTPGCSTRIHTGPFNGWPRELGHNDPNCPAGQGLGLALGLTNSIITARTENLFGKGEVKLYKVVSSGRAEEDVTITVRNWFSSQIPAGKQCLVGKIGCIYFLISADC